MTHVDRQNGVVAFKRFNNEGDVLLVLVNASDGQWGSNDYGVSLGGDSGRWREIFNSQAPLYGGVNTVGNPGDSIGANGGELWLNVPSWSTLVFQKL